MEAISKRKRSRTLDWLIVIGAGWGAVAASFGDWETAGSVAMFLLGLLTLEVREMRQDLQMDRRGRP